jgi:GNAT superfamily N-acetyltransferase
MVEIRQIQRTEFERAMEIAWKTFLEFEGDIYTEEGIKSFYNFIRDPLLEKMFLLGEYLIFGAFVAGKMVGIAGIRNKSHLSLLFVDKEYHKIGVGSALVFSAFQYSFEQYKEYRFSVNASPYALGFYHKLGFKDTADQITKDGVIYTPMCYTIAS